MDNRAIGYMDSGVGGLTVVKQALTQLPDEEIIYVGDTARMPYGPRPQAEVRDFTWQITNFLLEQDIKLLVIACNTATAAALPDLQAKLSIPVVGVIQPGIDAALHSKNPRVGVIATEGTVNSGAYAQGLASGKSDLVVEQLAAPEFVTAVETMDYQSETVAKIVENKLAYFKQHPVDTLIMGCTHFPLIETFIGQAMGPAVTLIDAGAESINVVEKILAEQDLKHALSVATKANRFYTTGSATHFGAIAKRWLEDDQLLVEGLAIKDDQVVLTNK
jgi:glutamate racemase